MSEPQQPEQRQWLSDLATITATTAIYWAVAFLLVELIESSLQDDRFGNQLAEYAEISVHATAVLFFLSSWLAEPIGKGIAEWEIRRSKRDDT